MQAVGSTLRRVAATSSLASRLARPATSSRAVVWESRRHASLNPLNWIRESLAVNKRQQNTQEELEAARKADAAKGQGNIFDAIAEDVKEEGDATEGATGAVVKAKKQYTHHKYSTANFKISHRKLNMLGRQISGKPIDAAILQMMFSEKRASKRIKSMLVVAKDHATGLKGLNEGKLVVAEAWVTKGPKQLKRIEPRGRGKMGIRVHPDSRLHVLLKEGKTAQEVKAADRKRKLKRIVSAGIVREDVPLRNPGPAWAW
ncbi:mitochondrial 50S ribosomal protein L22 [Trametopsis cervina]|nr:mitochondrial 50S ribosomal protein L22 [Trametopsis cervina]